MDRMWIGSVLVAAACSMPVTQAMAAQCVKQSPAHAVALIELYTSEGCSSCPPADRWVSAIDRNEYGVDRVIPLALHVDYWDQLGWKDRFASARYTQRQQSLSALTTSRVIYTPGIFLNSREFRDWRSPAQFQQAVRNINAQPAGADIRLELDPAPPAKLTVKASFILKPATRSGQPRAYVAVYENKLITDVKAGENRGVSLRHDYVVREWIGPVEINGGAAQYAGTLALDRGWIAKNLGVAAFIQDAASGEVLQATALPLCMAGSS